MSYCRAQPAGRGRSFGLEASSPLGEGVVAAAAAAAGATLDLCFLGLEVLRMGIVMPDETGKSTTAGIAGVVSETLMVKCCKCVVWEWKKDRKFCCEDVQRRRPCLLVASCASCGPLLTRMQCAMTTFVRVQYFHNDDEMS